MGVAGTGKTCFGQALASKLGMPYIEADDYHSDANKRKMAAGIALTDDDRWPWLEALADAVVNRDTLCVFSCSALRQQYRDVLARRLPNMTVIHLTGTPRLIEQRLTGRVDHFMPSSQLQDQLATLEPPAAAVEISIELGTDEQVAYFLKSQDAC